MSRVPRFSVVVPAFNAAATLPETLESVLAQEYADWECVIVDDGSTDSTPSTVESYCRRDSRFRLVRQKNMGAAEAYRTGIGAARSDLLVICAADDLLLPAHLQVMSDLIRRNPDCGIYSCNGQYLYHESGERDPVYTASEWMTERSLSFEDVVQVCFFSVGAVFRRQVYEVIGGHRSGVYVDDYDLWLRAMAAGARHRYTPEVLAVHRVSSFQQSADLVRLRESNIEVLQHLLAESALGPAQRGLVEARIARDTDQLSRDRVAPVLERQSQGLREVIQRALGPEHVDSAMAAIHRIAWIVRPVRRLVAWWQSR
jgi:glycosyltransferase involved in cell wall biosynthesis